jgi:YHS domain-containing protein
MTGGARRRRAECSSRAQGTLGERPPRAGPAVAQPAHGGGERMQTKGDDTMFDPICGKRVDPTGEAVEYKKRKYFFCSDRCKERFERQAERHRVQDLARMGALFANQKVRWGVA